MFYTYTLLCFLYKAILQLQITGRGIRKRKTSTRHTTNWAHSLSNPGNYQPGAGQAQAGQDRRCSVAATAKCQWESVREKKEAESEWNCQRKQEKQRKLTPRLHPTAPCCCCCAAMVCLPTGAAAADRVWVRTTLASLLNEPCCAWEGDRKKQLVAVSPSGRKKRVSAKKTPNLF